MLETMLGMAKRWWRLKHWRLVSKWLSDDGQVQHGDSDSARGILSQCLLLQGRGRRRVVDDLLMAC